MANVWICKRTLYREICRMEGGDNEVRIGIAR